MQPPAANGKKEDDEDPHPTITRIRRGLALLAIFVAVFAFYEARQQDDSRDCKTKVTTTVLAPEGAASSAPSRPGATSPVPAPARVVTEETCQQVPVTVLIPVLLLVLALMWPDLRSVEVFGLGRLERRIKAQGEEQEKLAAAQQQLALAVASNASASSQATQHLHIGTDGGLAQLAEAAVDSRKELPAAGSHPGEEERTAPSEQGLRARAEPLIPWLNLARRLSDPRFLQALRTGAASGSPSDDPHMGQRDAELLHRVERPGIPFAVSEFERWAAENALALDTVRDTLSAGPNAASESLRVATKFCDVLLSDLQRRGLVSS